MSAKSFTSVVDMLMSSQAHVGPVNTQVTESITNNRDPKPAKGVNLTGEEREELDRNKLNARKAVYFQDHEKAIEFQSVVLELTRKQWGDNHLHTVDALCSLAKSRFKNHQPHIAKSMYRQALKTIVENELDAKARVEKILQSIEQCLDAQHQAVAMSNLTMKMSHLHRQVRLEQPTVSMQKAQRLRRIADHLFDRKRYQRAALAYKAWSELPLLDANWHETSAFESLSRYGQSLMKSGQASEAQKIFRNMVSFHNASYAGCPTGIPLHKALQDWAESLRQSGEHSSAAMTVCLANKVLKK